MSFTAIHFTRLAAAALVAGAAAISASSAHAVDMRVAMACAGDYYSYCSQHPSEGSAVRQCMRANGMKLSKSCVNALVAAGEVSKEEVARKSASSTK